MNVTIDGVEYAPRHTADKGGEVKALHQLFSDARSHEGLTMAEVAKRVNLKPGHVVAAELGSATLKTAVILAAFYGIPMEQIARAVLRTTANAATR